MVIRRKSTDEGVAVTFEADQPINRNSDITINSQASDLEYYDSASSQESLRIRTNAKRSGVSNDKKVTATKLDVIDPIPLNIIQPPVSGIPTKSGNSNNDNNAEPRMLNISCDSAPAPAAIPTVEPPPDVIESDRRRSLSLRNVPINSEITNRDDNQELDPHLLRGWKICWIFIIVFMVCTYVIAFGLAYYSYLKSKGSDKKVPFETVLM